MSPKSTNVGTQGWTRRDALRMGFSAASLLALLPEGAIPALAQDEVEVPFTDLPSNFNPANPTAQLRILDIRKIDGLITPKDKFYAIQDRKSTRLNSSHT